MTPDQPRLAEALEIMAREFGRSVLALAEAMNQVMSSSSGERLRTLVQYYIDHPEELQRHIDRQERAASIEYCHCFCQWNHQGECATSAETTRLISGVTVPMCINCAAASDRRRALPISDPTPGDSIGPAA